MHKRIAAGIAAGAFLIAAAGASFVIPSLVAAADPSASPAAIPSATGSTTPASTNPSSGLRRGECSGGQMPGGPGMGADDITAAANALGISETELTTALQGGQTLAQVAATQNVDVQTLIDAMVAAEKSEIEADATAGNMTQAQADQQIANLTQHETDEVNGVMGSGPDGRHGQRPAKPSSGSSNNPTTTTTSGSTTS